ncbi:MAG: acyl-CoA dehydrogenase [Acidimicrobiales bacterium]|nr:MAG: acyl-CoA dehydrogenase [Acidimicrobiales bacterium]
MRLAYDRRPMDLRYTEEEEHFRDELRSWLAGVLPDVPPVPADHTDLVARRAYDTAWQAQLHEAGYAGIHWPAEFGGRGSTPTEHLIFLEETERAGAPYVGVNFVGQLHAGPTLIAEATDEQRATHLAPILKGEHVWCQGFSEPGSGSDLASLSTRAIDDGDDYVVTGQKIWTSFAQVADYCELLVRTDPEAPKHKGITWVIMPMNLDGIEIRPIDTALGSGEFAEMFLDEVRIPKVNRVGDENDGWRVTNVTFSFERGTAFISEVISSQRLLADLAQVAQKVTRRSGTAWDDAGIRRELGRLDAELDALWSLTKRNVSQAQRTGMVGPGGSVFKLAYADVRKRMADLAEQVLGRAGLAIGETMDLSDLDHVGERLYTLTLTIAAGTSEIQRNIIGERLLGLPRER